MVEKTKTRLDQIVTVLLGIFCVIGSIYFFEITLDHQRATNKTASEAVDTAKESLKQSKEARADISQAAAASVAAQYAAQAAQASAAQAAAAKIEHRKFESQASRKQIEELYQRNQELRASLTTLQQQFDQFRKEK